MNLLQSNELTMSSREVSGLTGKRHSDVMRDISVIQDQLGERKFAAMSSYMDSANRPQPMYIMNHKDVMTLITGYSVKMRVMVIDRWQELENQKPKEPVLPANYIEALESLIASEKEKALLAEQIEQQKPAVSFVADYVEASTGSKTFREVAKLLKENERELRAFLSDNKIMYKQAGTWYAYAQHQDAGRFEVKTGVKNGYNFNTTRFTAKGFAWLAGEIGRSKALQLV